MEKEKWELVFEGCASSVVGALASTKKELGMEEEVPPIVFFAGERDGELMARMHPLEGHKNEWNQSLIKAICDASMEGIRVFLLIAVNECHLVQVKPESALAEAERLKSIPISKHPDKVEATLVTCFTRNEGALAFSRLGGRIDAEKLVSDLANGWKAIGEEFVNNLYGDVHEYLSDWRDVNDVDVEFGKDGG